MRTYIYALFEYYALYFLCIYTTKRVNMACVCVCVHNANFINMAYVQNIDIQVNICRSNILCMAFLVAKPLYNFLWHALFLFLG